MAAACRTPDGLKWSFLSHCLSGASFAMLGASAPFAPPLAGDTHRDEDQGATSRDCSAKRKQRRDPDRDRSKQQCACELASGV